MVSHHLPQALLPHSQRHSAEIFSQPFAPLPQWINRDLPEVVVQNQAGWRGAGETKHPPPAAARRTRHTAAFSLAHAFLQHAQPAATSVHFSHDYQGERG